MELTMALGTMILVQLPLEPMILRHSILRTGIRICHQGKTHVQLYPQAQQEWPWL